MPAVGGGSRRGGELKKQSDIVVIIGECRTKMHKVTGS